MPQRSHLCPNSHSGTFPGMNNHIQVTKISEILIISAEMSTGWWCLCLSERTERDQLKVKTVGVSRSNVYEDVAG